MSSSGGASIIGAIGGLVSGFGQMQSAGAETQMGEYNAQVYEQNAQATRQSAALNASQKRKSAEKVISSQTAIYAHSGIKMSGSPLEVMLDSYANSEMDIAIDNYNSEVQARGYENKAGVARYEAAQKARVGYAQAGSSLLSTAANIFQTSQPLGAKGTSLGAGTTSQGVSVPSRYVPPK